MARGGQGAHPHRRADLYLIPVIDRLAIEGHGVSRVDVVSRSGGLRQCQPSGHVVVVNVRFEHVGDTHAPLLGEREESVDVALRVHHERHVAIGDEVAAVAQCGRVECDDVYHLVSPRLTIVGSGVVLSQAPLRGIRVLGVCADDRGSSL